MSHIRSLPTPNLANPPSRTNNNQATLGYVRLLHRSVMEMLRAVQLRLNPLIDDANDREVAEPLPGYTVAELPAAADHTRSMVYVTDEVGGAVPAFSDGSDWRRVTDRAVVST